jgi:hypothetical protein
MALEECEALAVALDRLSPDDWTAANATFADNDDPLFGRSPKVAFDSLFARIPTLAPEPFGLAVRKPWPFDDVEDRMFKVELPLRNTLLTHSRNRTRVAAAGGRG